jgi:hypothetical protein
MPDGPIGSRVRWLRRARESGLGVRSDGKLCAHFRGHSHWPAGLSIDGTPERARLRQELAITLAPDFGEALERDPGGFADPCAKHDFVAQSGRHLVVDLVAQHDPADSVLGLAVGDCSPMRDGNILDPPQVNDVVDVILLVDVAWQNRNGHFESGGGVHLASCD